MRSMLGLVLLVAALPATAADVPAAAPVTVTVVRWPYT